MTTICTNSSGLIIMVGDGCTPTPPDGGGSYVLTGQQAATYRALDATPNGGITYIGGVFAALPYVPRVDPFAGRAATLAKIAELEASHIPADQIEALKLRISLLGG